MTKAKQLPYVNRFTGDIKVLPKSQGNKLSEDWARAKVVRNSEGKKVFRFKLSAPVKGRDGKTHMGTAIVDLTETDQPVEGEVVDGNGNTK